VELLLHQFQTKNATETMPNMIVAYLTMTGDTSSYTANYFQNFFQSNVISVRTVLSILSTSYFYFNERRLWRSWH